MSDFDNIDSTDKELRAAAAELNEIQEKERMAEKIVANSAEYTDTDTVIEDFPTKTSLATKLDLVTPAGVSTDTTANTDSDEFDDIPSGILTENTDSDESDDSDGHDVGSGVLN
ncbi:hypothetical protein ACAH01_14760 [Halomicrobium sp. HM KBTZ05]|uniref:hypothetical protein n=1 Tax=Halomicrobium sp. HM KBTZ05 TaxID=3242663 RepID=UPI003558D060